MGAAQGDGCDHRLCFRDSLDLVGPLEFGVGCARIVDAAVRVDGGECIPRDRVDLDVFHPRADALRSTASCGARFPGISAIVKYSGVTEAIVRLIPSIAMKPFSTMNRSIGAGR